MILIFVWNGFLSATKSGTLFAFVTNLFLRFTMSNIFSVVMKRNEFHEANPYDHTNKMHENITKF